MQPSAVHTWFLEIIIDHASVCVSVHVCVSVCPPLRAIETSGMIWCDIGRVRLVKQLSWLFPAFNYFIRHLPSIKWMGVAILAQHVVNACQGDMILATEGLPERRSATFIKVSERMHSDAFKRRPAFNLTETIPA